MKKILLVVAIVFTMMGSSKAWYIEHCNGHYITTYRLVCGQHADYWEMETSYVPCGSKRYTTICEIVTGGTGTVNPLMTGLSSGEMERLQSMAFTLPVEVKESIDNANYTYETHTMDELDPHLKSFLVKNQMVRNSIKNLKVTPNPIQERKVKYSYQSSNEQQTTITLLDAKNGSLLVGGTEPTAGSCGNTTGIISVPDGFNGKAILKVVSENLTLSKRILIE